MNQERIMKVLVGPHLSEKATLVADKFKQVVFKVARDATKPEIKDAVESLFNVKVKAVSTTHVKGKERRFGKIIGRRKSWKKAYISLHEGHDINFASFGE